MTSIKRLVKEGTVRGRKLFRKFTKNTVAEAIGTTVFATGSVFRIDSTSSDVNTMLFNSESMVVGRIAGRGASRSSRSDWLWKKLLRTFALSCSLVYIWSLFSMGGMCSVIWCYDFKVDHQSLEEMEFEVSFAATLS